VNGSNLQRPMFDPTTDHPGRDCPGCGSSRTLPFFELPRVPTNSCILFDSVEEAINCKQGSILLCLCEDCGFIGNLAFEPDLTEYSERYEETQGFSPTFSNYLQELSVELIDRFGLEGKRIVEIGCGKGEFLAQLCELAGAEGLGFDPAFREDRNPNTGDARVRYVQEFFSENYARLDADFYCSRMTLEHIPEVGEFLSMLHRSIGHHPEAIVYTQVPEVLRILEEGLFCDVPYEHCSYFTEDTLTIALERAGFEYVGSDITYAGQHLAVTGRPSKPRITQPKFESLRRVAMQFPKRSREQASRCMELLERTTSAGERVVLWGSGSKPTALLTSLGIREGVEQVVDINPHRHGKFMAGTGQEIIAPEDLKENPPDHVIIMNPIYHDEIRTMLADIGLAPYLHDLGGD
jgi:SAM-dependent methyltransferase